MTILFLFKHRWIIHVFWWKKCYKNGKLSESFAWEFLWILLLLGARYFYVSLFSVVCTTFPLHNNLKHCRAVQCLAIFQTGSVNRIISYLQICCAYFVCLSSALKYYTAFYRQTSHFCWHIVRNRKLCLLLSWNLTFRLIRTPQKAIYD